MAWKKGKALTTPPRVLQPTDSKWIKIAEKNGIGYVTFHTRIHAMGWDPEKAATEPLVNRHQHMAMVAKTRRVYPVEMIEKAARNGISYVTFKQRIYRLGWSMEDAATIPIVTR